MKQRYKPFHLAAIEVLRETREAAGISQHALSIRLGRAGNFVHRIESGERMLSVPEFMEYTTVLGVDPAKIIQRIRAKAS